MKDNTKDKKYGNACDNRISAGENYTKNLGNDASTKNATTDPEQKYLVWVDCEMTGLDISVDELIEVAVRITDYDLNYIDDGNGLSLSIIPTEKALSHMNDFVTAMHVRSGLLEVLKGNCKDEKPVSLKEAEERTLNYIKKYVPEANTANLAGNTIHSDKKFLEKYMPSVIDYLHYRLIDVSTIKMLTKYWNRDVYESAPEKDKNHRALGDIIESINELRHYKKEIFDKAETR